MDWDGSGGGATRIQTNTDKETRRKILVQVRDGEGYKHVRKTMGLERILNLTGPVTKGMCN